MNMDAKIYLEIKNGEVQKSEVKWDKFMLLSMITGLLQYCHAKGHFDDSDIERVCELAKMSDEDLNKRAEKSLMGILFGNTKF